MNINQEWEQDARRDALEELLTKAQTTAVNFIAVHEKLSQTDYQALVDYLNDSEEHEGDNRVIANESLKIFEKYYTQPGNLI
jgi:hypothetical protein